jgi:tRNA (cmo5U34)-methyltransferase
LEEADVPKDTLFKTTKKIKGAFVFDERTARVFDDMLSRSVPFYVEIQRMIAELALSFVCNKSDIYDIGCSTGITLLNLAKRAPKQTRLIGIDLSGEMLKKAKARLRKKGVLKRCVLKNADLNQDLEIKNASVAIMNLTLQFVKPAKRYFVLKKIYNGLNKGGCLILVEKIKSNETKFEDRFVEFYYDLKMRNHYSKLEIYKKREALENVLIPYTYDANLQLLKKSGFKLMDSFFRWYNFCGMIAVKE